MDRLNKKSTFILISLGLFAIISYFLLFPKQKDYYEITMNPELLNLSSENFYGHTGLLKKEKTYGISLSVRKFFVSTNESKRMLLGGSTEKGINGIVTPINIKMEILYGNSQKMEVLESLFSEDLKLPSKLSYGESENNFYQEKNSLSKFAKDINNGKPYTKGISFYNTDLYFVFNKKIDSLLKLQNSKLYFKIQDQYGHITTKRLK